MSEDAKKSVPFFATPIGQITASVLLWIVACVFAAAAVIVVDQMKASTSMQTVVELQVDPDTGETVETEVEVPYDNPESNLIMTYLAFAPSTIAVVLSIFFLIVGSVRWAIFGPKALPSVTLNLTRELSLLESINQRLLLSETAKKIAYRLEDIAVLRQTIRDDIRKAEFDAAMVLVQELAGTYGQLEEAETFRSEIDQARTKDQEAKIAAGITQMDKHLAAHDFSAASKEAARLKRLYPESHAVDDLDKRVTIAKEQHKKDLERAFLLANEREEVDRALEIMKKLDHLLTPEEAEPFREVARGVIGKKRDNLGVQFKLAVHDREWTQAVTVGEQIIKDFPNTRMADEVRGRIDQLRANAAGQQQATSPPITTVN